MFIERSHLFMDIVKNEGVILYVILEVHCLCGYNGMKHPRRTYMHVGHIDQTSGGQRLHLNC